MNRIFTSLLMLCSYSMSAQEWRLAGTVKDNTGTPVVSATVSLLQASDSSWVQSSLTTENGEYSFDKVVNGKYLLDIQALGFVSKKLAVPESQSARLDVVLDKRAGTLDQVTVTASKPFIENGPGKMVVNVGSMVQAIGSTAYDVLVKSPGVTIDAQGNISIQGKQGITVLINERPTYLSGRELVDYLKSLPSDDVAQLELITQPSSRYDAEGSSGIINIVQKKNRKEGFNGSINITPGYGIYPTFHNNGRLTWKKGKLNSYINASYMEATGFLRADYKRDLVDDEKNILTHMEGDAFMKEHFSDAMVRAGADYDVNDKTIGGVLINYNYHPNTQLDESKDYITDVASSATFFSHALHERGFLRKRIAANAYLKNKINNKHNIITNADYTRNFTKSRQLLDNKNQKLSGEDLGNGLLVRSWTPTTIDAKSLKSDYTGELSKTTKIEAGVKCSYTTTDNNAMFDIYTPEGWVYDSARTNRFVYKENINAAYFSVNHQFGERWKTQAGLRMENTNTSGLQDIGNQYFERHFTNVFPTAYISYTVNKKNEVQLNCGRRINRPQYNRLNPFAEYISQYYYEIGNPELNPEITTDVELTHVYNSMLTTRAWYSKTTSGMNAVTFKDSKPNTAYRQFINIAEGSNTGLSASMYKKLLDWWEISINGWASYTSFYNANTKEHRSGSGWGVDLDSQFAFKDGWKAETHIGFTGPYQDGLYTRVKPAIWTSAGVSKKVLKDSGTIALNIEDPFLAYRHIWASNTGEVIANGQFKYHTIHYGLSFVYNFGRETNGKQRENVTDEAKRM
ncbi:TonB-dependent receptor [Polluticoccus soli]|uniref:TonB-dependent receptor n=1 Tax=Polluticoccus soli TaxID=3034150 RepID=UPI0023E1B052|nr:TonB-dependent receptor [Flavipsychrobacter sp. JY13-12]